jgi:hypothetical protein
MLGAATNDISVLVRLAVAERTISCIRYVASAARRFEPDSAFWRELLECLPNAPVVPDGVMPHPTRFVSMTGFTRHGAETVAVWIRPQPDLVPAHG